MILPVAALAFGCESAPAPPSAEAPAANQGDNPEAAEATTPTQPATPKSTADDATPSPPSATAEPPATSASAPVERDDKPSQVDKPTQEGAEKAPKAGSGEAATRRGAAARGEGFAAWLESKPSYKVNESASLQVVLTAEDPFKCNEQYPYRFQLTPAAGLTFPEPTVRNMNISKQRSVMSVPFTPTASGSQTVSGELSFSVCTDDKCLIEKQPLSITVTVEGS